MGRRRSLWLALAVAGVLLVTLAFASWRWLDRKVARLASPESHREKSTRELLFRPLARSEKGASLLGDGSVRTLARLGDALWTGGGSGLDSGLSPLTPADGLASLRVASIAVFKESLVYALEAGGWGRVTVDGPEEASSGFGTLHVRHMAASPASELYLAAAEGLFRVSPGGQEIERLDASSFRAVLLLPSGGLLAGGETGLALFPAASSVREEVPAPDPWIEDLAFDGANVWVSTASGIALGALDGRSIVLNPHPKGFGLSSGVLWRGRWIAPSGPGERHLTALAAGGDSAEIAIPEPFPRVLAWAGQLFGDGDSGLHVYLEDGTWQLVKKRPSRSLPWPHVNALAVRETDAWLGFFDGPIVRFRNLDSIEAPGSREPWGVNALLSAGGAVYAATLRGAYRIAGGAFEKLPGGGAAFSVAESPEGVIFGFGEGVLFPGPRLLSAFHGLPGNQAYALAAGSRPGTLWVGTPSGLGRIEGRRITLRVARGEGRLPHPWITALVEADEGLWIATYGGGICRVAESGGGLAWTSFPETAGLKVNPGALVRTPSGDVIFGTQGQGLWGLQSGTQQFQRLRIPLPSTNVFSLALYPATSPATLLAGADEGLAFLPLAALFKP